MRKCSICKNEKDDEQFYKTSSYCKGCFSERSRAKFVWNDYEVNKQMMKKFGITLEDYNKLFEKQSGKCGICGKEVKQRLDIDHSHKTQIVRGLLCRCCNMGLGYFKDNIELLNKAGQWLEVR